MERMEYLSKKLCALCMERMEYLSKMLCALYGEDGIFE